MKPEIVLFWFRRDLRLHDNAGLLAALRSGSTVLPIFIFDTEILDRLPENDARVHFIHSTISNMRKKLHMEYGSSIALYHGNPLSIFKKLLSEYTVQSVYANRDYEPYALKRDRTIQEYLQSKNISFRTYKDQVIFEKDEIAKEDGTPYVVYSPYMRKWKNAFTDTFLEECDTFPYLNRLLQKITLPNVSLSDLGFIPSGIPIPTYDIDTTLIKNYEHSRNYPAIEKGTTKLGIHLRFGTVSIREVVQKAVSVKNETFWNELIWREFFMQILWHFPHTVHRAFRPKYDRIAWRNDVHEFNAWKNGKTGYPLVDAGMRELNATGHMHNRVRMLAASFLCKHLLIDWRWGEAYFAEKLLDYELSSNVGNWQWAAGSGVDAAPYFRIFNPSTQVLKFDKQRAYITKWLPDLQELHYPIKIVDHKMARERCLKIYRAIMD